MYIRWQDNVNDYFGVVYCAEVSGVSVIAYTENVYQPLPLICSLEDLNDNNYREIGVEKYYDLLHQHVILMMKEICRKGQK